MVLTNHTLDFLEKHWAKEVDFVVCECYCVILIL